MKRDRYMKRNYYDEAVEIIMAAPEKSPGVELAKLCVAKDYGVAEVAEYLGVTRMTVYSWFYGQRVPKYQNLAKVTSLIEKLRSMIAEESPPNDNQTQLPAEHTTA